MSAQTSPGGSTRRFLDADAAEILARAARPARALFLDRDGVINLDHGYVHAPAATEWIPGIFELCQAARGAGYPIIVVTNQAGIARGLYSEQAFLDYTRWMHGEFARRGIPLLATFYCPHHPTAGAGPLTGPCECRKPKPGMIRAALDEFGIDAGRSVLVGDKDSDASAGEAAGIGTIVNINADGNADPPATDAVTVAAMEFKRSHRR